MRFGICASVKQTAMLKTITFDYLEENVKRFLMPEQSDEDFAAQLREARALPVPIEAANSFIPPDLPLIATPTQQVDRIRLKRYVKTALRRAEQTGMRVIVFGSGGARACPAGYDHADALRQIGEHLATWSAWACNHGVEIVLEPLRYQETNTLNTVAESGAFVAPLADSGARLLADLYHMSCNREDPASILPWKELLRHVHVAEERERAAPGRYGEDFRPAFSVLHQAGYDLRISIECKWQDPTAEVDPGIATLRKQWAESIR